MTDMVTRFVWFNESGEIMEHDMKNPSCFKYEDLACVLLVGLEKNVDYLVARLQGKER